MLIKYGYLSIVTTLLYQILSWQARFV